MPSRPNIVLIVTDQHRFDALGVNGSTVCRTPHLDALANEGVNFSNAYTCIALCTPARVSLFTGMLPHRHGITRNTEALSKAARSIPQDMPTIADRLRELDYQCGLEGKWHAGDRLPSQCGFVGLDTIDYGSATSTPEYADHLKTLCLDEPKLITEGVGWHANLTLAGRMTGPVEASVPYFVAQRTIDRMAMFRETDQPFFLAACFWGPHAPYIPCEPYASMYEPGEIKAWPNFADCLLNKPTIYKRHRDAFIGEGRPPRSWRDCAMWAARYFGFVTQIDEQIGRIVEYAGDDTVIIFTADHGDLCGAHGGMHDKNSMMVQELYHIPLIVRHPATRLIAGQADCEAPVSLIDIPPTIIDLAGNRAAADLDGRSLVPLICGDPIPSHWPDHVVAQTFGTHYAYEARMIVSGRFKYVFHLADIDELYDLEADPWEMHNLINRDEFHDTLKTLRRTLIEWARVHGDPISGWLKSLYDDRSHCTIKNARPYGT